MLTARRIAGDGWEDIAMNALEETLIWLFRLARTAQRAGIDARIQKAVHYLAAHPGESFCLARLAALCALSPSRFSHLFSKELGITPQRFSERLRLECAHHLLVQTNLSISDIAADVGFEDPLYFSRRFRYAFGHAPTAARTRTSGSPPPVEIAAVARRAGTREPQSMTGGPIGRRRTETRGTPA
jgi:AraC family transcriptional regulator of arabinose operon